MTTPNADADVHTALASIIQAHDTVLFMKGSKLQPQCGFSSKVAGILGYLEVSYQDVNVLEDGSIRDGIKAYSDWPTIPQLYIKGEFIGGCDIVVEMTMSGELDTLLESKGIAYNKAAAEAIRQHNS